MARHSGRPFWHDPTRPQLSFCLNLSLVSRCACYGDVDPEAAAWLLVPAGRQRKPCTCCARNRCTACPIPAAAHTSLGWSAQVGAVAGLRPQQRVVLHRLRRPDHQDLGRRHGPAEAHAHWPHRAGKLSIHVRSVIMAWQVHPAAVLYVTVRQRHSQNLRAPLIMLACALRTSGQRTRVAGMFEAQRMRAWRRSPGSQSVTGTRTCSPAPWTRRSSAGTWSTTRCDAGAQSLL